MAPTSRGSAAKEYDVVISGHSVDSLAVDIITHIWAKGFCVIDARLDEEVLRKARQDIEDLDSQGLLKQPPDLVHDGLLGSEGSAQILDFLKEGLTDPQASDLRHLRQLDNSMTELVAILQLVVPEMGWGTLQRTHAIVHETGLAPCDPPELTELEASYWLGNFVQSKLMVLLCLGPVRGTLELQPFDEEAEAHEVPTIPGSIIVLRADAMWHRHFAHSKAHVLSCFMVEARPTTKSKLSEQTMFMTPCATEIQKWAINRMRQLKEEETATDSKIELPNGWLTAMNHMFHTAQRIAVRGSAARYAGTWNVDDWYKSQTAGVDLITEVPLCRWDADLYFDADVEGWRSFKSFLRHGSFVDGAELFDNKFFGLSAMEASGMDPHQRVVLEVGYEALRKAGYVKGKLMNSLGGVYLGSSMTIFGQVSTVSGATGGAASINSNRFSFCLGLKGPSMTCDTDGSSSLTAVHLGAEAVLDKGRGVANAYSLSGGVSFQLGPHWLPQLQAAGLLSVTGRCCTWDSSADGYAMGDGCGFVVLKRIADWVDGVQVYIEGEPLVGTICGSTLNSNGCAASLSAPHGPSEQELVAQALRSAGLDPTNIDAVECNGQACFLADAVEVSSLLRVLRGEDICAPLGVTAVKSLMGHASECAGVASLQRVLLAGSWGAMTPNCHLHQLNPHMDFGGKGNLITDCLEYRMLSMYVGVTARGFGGTNVHVVSYGQIDASREPTVPEEKKSYFNFWPGGGGELQDEQQPSRGYFIAGTFSRWEMTKMEREGDDTYGFTVVLGENRWEEFQILLDGDSQRRLHPGFPEAPKGSIVQGPDAQVEGLNWRIEGRGAVVEASDEVVLGNLEKTNQALRSWSPDAQSEPGLFGAGIPGDRYRVLLRIAGKYRTVMWEKLPQVEVLKRK